ncbi:unnamed protein product [Phytophthora lilii]|uniref:Unnamed protein product n=1 Tax=Phytophthora lilii TaxID=2077276 RepID=A0A9W6U1X4_9STRA|nr:unnamed protein product [Phytophthora lilii]
MFLIIVFKASFGLSSSSCSNSASRRSPSRSITPDDVSTTTAWESLDPTVSSTVANMIATTLNSIKSSNFRPRQLHPSQKQLSYLSEPPARTTRWPNNNFPLLLYRDSVPAASAIARYSPQALKAIATTFSDV